VSYRTIYVMSMLVMCGMTARVVARQDPPPAAPVQAPAADPFKFSHDAGLIIWAIKEDQVESFELGWSVIRTRLLASPRAELKALGESLRVFRSVNRLGPEGTTYMFIADPASKTTSYGLSPFLLYESGLFARPEADELFKLLQGAIIQISPVGLSAVN
jgi:hypothetical protein